MDPNKNWNLEKEKPVYWRRYDRRYTAKIAIAWLYLCKKNSIWYQMAINWNTFSNNFKFCLLHNFVSFLFQIIIYLIINKNSLARSSLTTSMLILPLLIPVFQYSNYIMDENKDCLQMQNEIIVFLASKLLRYYFDIFIISNRNFLFIR